MLSSNALKLLKWLSKQDRWINQKELEDRRNYDERSLRFLVSENYLESSFDLDGGHWAKYRISEQGKAYLKEVNARRVPELRDWINTIVPVITFLAGMSFSEPIKKVLKWLVSLLG